jgi:hypothetical protein
MTPHQYAKSSGAGLGHCARCPRNSDKSGDLTLEQEKKIEALDRYILQRA